MKDQIYSIGLAILGLTILGPAMLCFGIMNPVEATAQRLETRDESGCEDLILDDMHLGTAPISSCEIDIYDVTFSDLKVIGELVTLHPGFEASSSVGDTLHIKSTANPLVDSIRGAHGSPIDTDPNPPLCHFDKVAGFLTGRDSLGNEFLDPHCPDSWNRTRIHRNPKMDTDPSDWTNTEQFYETTSDLDSTHGIDLAMVFFYAGHGVDETQLTWVQFKSLSGEAESDDMLIGDGDHDNGIGGMRYFLQHSCRMFAHGEKTVPKPIDYHRPDLFNPLDTDHQNIYDKWTNPSSNSLANELRMACGYSTNSSSSTGILENFWDMYTNQGMDVIDVWLEHNQSAATLRVPLCLTRSSSNYNHTPFHIDEEFTRHANWGGDTVWMIYMIDGTSGTDSKGAVTEKAPLVLPVLKASIDSVGQPYIDELQTDVDVTNWMTGQDVNMSIFPTSGAMAVKGEKNDVLAEDVVLSQEQYVKAAENFIDGQNWTEYDMGKPTISLKMAQKPVMEKGEVVDVENLQVGVTVDFRRVIDFEGTRIGFLGNGGRMTVRMNNDGSVVTASRVWRDVNTKGEAEVKSYEKAYEEALLELGNSDAYELIDSKWGYKELMGSTEQDTMKIVYQFIFDPKNEIGSTGYSPRIVEIDGQ